MESTVRSGVGEIVALAKIWVKGSNALFGRENGGSHWRGRRKKKLPFLERYKPQYLTGKADLGFRSLVGSQD